VPTLNLEFLGNFLAELTLVVYGFLQYLPSLIAASAVFLAKLTLDPTVHPWVSMNIFYILYHILILP
jgi:cyclin A